MSKFWSPIVSRLKPYQAGEQPKLANLVKLNTNESPVGPSEKVLEAIRLATAESLRLYPDPEARELRSAIASVHGVDIGEVFVGNGSDEVLAHVFHGLLNHDQPLLYPDISYSFYPTYSALYGINAKTVPLGEDFTISIADYQGPAGGIILPNPNAPTGIALPLSDIRALVSAHPDAVVVIDEAYVDFGTESAIRLVKEFDNLLVVHTLSKSRALAGLRVGYAIGQRPLIEALERVKDSFNSYPLDRLAQAGATAAMLDTDWFEETRQMVMTNRERVTSGLTQRGFSVLPSTANFVFARHATRSGADLMAALRERAILVRHFNKPRIDQYLRISIGTSEECDRLIAALDEILA